MALGEGAGAVHRGCKARAPEARPPNIRDAAAGSAVRSRRPLLAGRDRCPALAHHRTRGSVPARPTALTSLNGISSKAANCVGDRQLSESAAPARAPPPWLRDWRARASESTAGQFGTGPARCSRRA